MPHDFGSFGSFGSRDQRSASGIGSGIGFHELRQACEISTLREDLERMSQETGALRDSVEVAVEQIRDRFAALSAAELTDANAMAPLLQFAVTTLLDIREQTRRLNTRTGPLPDDDRPAWVGAADAPPVRTLPAEPSPIPPEPPRDLVPREPMSPERPAPSAPVAAAPPSPPSASWLASKDVPPPPPSRAATARSNGPAAKLPGGIDWLSPAGR